MLNHIAGHATPVVRQHSTETALVRVAQAQAHHGAHHGAVAATDTLIVAGRSLGRHVDTGAAGRDARPAATVNVRAAGSPRASRNVVHALKTRAAFDAMFSRGPTVTAGAPTEIKFLIQRDSGEVFFLPTKFKFHFEFYRDVLHGTMDNAEFNERAYNRPDRAFIAGTVTAYDSYEDPNSGVKGQVCFSLWPTDNFDAALLKETHDAVRGGLPFLGDADVAFRPGGAKQEKLVQRNRAALDAARIDVKSNTEISKGLKFMALSEGKAVGRLVIVDKGEAMPLLTRKDIVLFLGDVPPEAPPVAAIFTTTVQTFNSHLGIKYRQDDTPYFYKAFTDAELADLKALNGAPVTIACDGKDATVSRASQAQAKAYLKKIKPKGHIRLTPHLAENKARFYGELKALSVGADGLWNKDFLASYGRKSAGLIELAKLSEAHAFRGAGGAGAPTIVTPKQPGAIPANWYTRFIKTATDNDGVTFSERIRTLTADPRFTGDDSAADAWKSKALAKLRKDIANADMPAELLTDVKEQVAAPYLHLHRGINRMRIRSSSAVVEDGGRGALPNMAGAFDSHTARWETGRNAAETLDNATKDIAKTIMQDYASVFNDRAIAELQWNNVDLDEESVAMALAVMPNEDDELANGVIRVNVDLAGFFSITGETQFGENLVTNPEKGAVPDTFIDGDYDVLDGAARQDIEYERFSNQTSNAPGREHAFTDKEINATYDGMRIVRSHFAQLDGKAPEAYIDECEVKVTANGQLLFKQERPWVE